MVREHWKVGGASALDVDEGEAQAVLWTYVMLVGGMAMFSYGVVSTDGMFFTVTGIVATLLGVALTTYRAFHQAHRRVFGSDWLENMSAGWPTYLLLALGRLAAVGMVAWGLNEAARRSNDPSRMATPSVVTAAQQGADGVTYTFTTRDDPEASGTFVDHAELYVGERISVHQSTPGVWELYDRSGEAYVAPLCNDRRPARSECRHRRHQSPPQTSRYRPSRHPSRAAVTGSDSLRGSFGDDVGAT